MENRDPGNKTSSLTLRDGWWVPDADRVCFGIVRREVNDLQHILPLCKSYRRVIQAGGNVGIWPKALAAQFEQVVTFEPDEANYAALYENTKDVPNILRVHAGLGLYNARAGIDHIDPSNIGAHQIAPEGDAFEIVPLDQYGYEDVDFLQLDVEGFEHFAVMGAEQTIRASWPVICLELKGLGKRYGVEDEDTVEFLRAMGYSMRNRVHRDVIFTKG